MLTDGAGGDPQACWAHTRSNNLGLLVSLSGSSVCFPLTWPPSKIHGMSTRWVSAPQASWKPNLRLSHPKQESSPQNDYREGGWPWLCPFKGSVSILLPRRGFWLESLELVQASSSSRARCDSEKPDFSGVPGELLLHGRLPEPGCPDSFLVHTVQAGLLCLGDNICMIRVLTDKKIYDFKHSRLPANIGNR